MTTTTTTGKWQNISAGPRQVKDLNRAIAALRSEGQTHDELTGVIGGTEHRSTYLSMFGAIRPEATALDEAIREKRGYQITRDNVRAIIASYEAALPEARKSRPVEDSRRTAEEDAELTAKAAARDAKDKAERDAQNAILDQVMARAPAGAKALIIAEYREDTSDPMSDYFASRTARTVAIGFRFGSREDFRALRAAAAQFPETAHLASDDCLSAWLEARGVSAGMRDSVEHRDNYSMGAGNYLSDHGGANSGTGWIVKSCAIPCQWVHLTEDAIPVPVNPGRRSQPDDGPVTISPSSIGRDGVVEIRFADRPGDEVLSELKAHGFRWARGNRCWYGRDTAYAESLAGA